MLLLQVVKIQSTHKAHKVISNMQTRPSRIASQQAMEKTLVILSQDDPQEDIVEIVNDETGIVHKFDQFVIAIRGYGSLIFKYREQKKPKIRKQREKVYRIIVVYNLIIASHNVQIFVKVI